MSDLISRRDAINEIKNVFDDVLCCNVSVRKGLPEAIRRIEMLPSAEPKTGKNTNANEIYNYLKDRIGDIVDDMKEFDAWFERMVWHVKECNRLTAEPKTGEWVDDCACSICHWIHEDNNGFALITKYNFCPNCGADMRGEKEHGSCE